MPQPRPETDRRRPRRRVRRRSRGRPAARVRAAAVQRRPARRQRAPFVLLVVGLLCGGLVSLLLLNTVLAQDSIADARLRERDLHGAPAERAAHVESTAQTQPTHRRAGRGSRQKPSPGQRQHLHQPGPPRPARRSRGGERLRAAGVKVPVAAAPALREGPAPLVVRRVARDGPDARAGSARSEGAGRPAAPDGPPRRAARSGRTPSTCPRTSTAPGRPPRLDSRAAAGPSDGPRGRARRDRAGGDADSARGRSGKARGSPRAAGTTSAPVGRSGRARPTLHARAGRRRAVAWARRRTTPAVAGPAGAATAGRDEDRSRARFRQDGVDGSRGRAGTTRRARVAGGRRTMTGRASGAAPPAPGHRRRSATDAPAPAAAAPAAAGTAPARPRRRSDGPRRRRHPGGHAAPARTALADGPATPASRPAARRAGCRRARAGAGAGARGRPGRAAVAGRTTGRSPYRFGTPARQAGAPAGGAAGRHRGGPRRPPAPPRPPLMLRLGNPRTADQRRPHRHDLRAVDLRRPADPAAGPRLQGLRGARPSPAPAHREAARQARRRSPTSTATRWP